MLLKARLSSWSRCIITKQNRRAFRERTRSNASSAKWRRAGDIFLYPLLWKGEHRERESFRERRRTVKARGFSIAKKPISSFAWFGPGDAWKNLAFHKGTRACERRIIICEMAWGGEIFLCTLCSELRKEENRTGEEREREIQGRGAEWGRHVDGGSPYYLIKTAKEAKLAFRSVGPGDRKCLCLPPRLVSVHRGPLTPLPPSLPPSFWFLFHHSTRERACQRASPDSPNSDLKFRLLFKCSGPGLDGRLPRFMPHGFIWQFEKNPQEIMQETQVPCGIASLSNAADQSPKTGVLTVKKVSGSKLVWRGIKVQASFFQGGRRAKMAFSTFTTVPTTYQSRNACIHSSMSVQLESPPPPRSNWTQLWR